jgi:hypothetical protein
MHPSRKVYQMRKSTVKSTTAGASVPAPELKELIEQQKKLNKKIIAIENRLRFGYSEPLHDYRTALMREDVFLSAKIMDALLALHA